MIYMPTDPLQLLLTEFPQKEISGYTGVGSRTIARHSRKYNPKPYIHNKYLIAVKEMWALEPVPEDKDMLTFYELTGKLVKRWGTAKWVRDNLK